MSLIKMRAEVAATTDGDDVQEWANEVGKMVNGVKRAFNENFIYDACHGVYKVRHAAERAKSIERYFDDFVRLLENSKRVSGIDATERGQDADPDFQKLLKAVGAVEDVLISAVRKAKQLANNITDADVKRDVEKRIAEIEGKVELLDSSL